MRKIIPWKPIKTSTDDDNFIAEREQHYTICKIFFPEFFRVAWRSLHGLLEMANGLQEYFMASKEKNPDLTVIQETLANCSFESLEDIIQALGDLFKEMGKAPFLEDYIVRYPDLGLAKLIPVSDTEKVVALVENMMTELKALGLEYQQIQSLHDVLFENFSMYAMMINGELNTDADFVKKYEKSLADLQTQICGFSDHGEKILSPYIDKIVRLLIAAYEPYEKARRILRIQGIDLETLDKEIADNYPKTFESEEAFLATVFFICLTLDELAKNSTISRDTFCNICKSCQKDGIPIDEFGTVNPEIQLKIDALHKTQQE